MPAAFHIREVRQGKLAPVYVHEVRWEKPAALSLFRIQKREQSLQRISRGSLIETINPSLFSAWKVPPWARMILHAIGRPKPWAVPGSVSKFSSTLSGTPCPLSAITIRTQSVSREAETVIWQPFSLWVILFCSRL